MRQGSRHRGYPEILDKPMRAESRHYGRPDLEVVSAQPLKGRFDERLNTLTSHYGIDPNDTECWKKLAAALLGFDFEGFEAPEAGWERLARTLVRERFPG